MPVLEKTKELLSRAKSTFSSKPDIPEAESLHSDLVKVVTQLKATQNIMSDNSTTINELAMDNTELSGLLKEIATLDTKDIEEKILSREGITQEEADKLLKSLDLITKTVSGIGVSLDINLGSLIDDFKPLLSDTRLDIASRRKILEEIRKFVEMQDVPAEALKDLQDINIKQLNFTKSESKQLNTVLTTLSESTKEITTKATLTELNDSLDSAVLTQKELSDVLEKKTESGETFGDKFKRIPQVFSTGALEETKAAGISTGLDAIIPGLGALLEATGTTSKISEAVSFGGIKSLVGKGIGASKSALTSILPTRESSVESELADKVENTIDNTSDALLDETQKNTKELSDVNNSLSDLVEGQENMQDVSEQQLEATEEGFEDLEKSQKKISRRSGRGGGKGIGSSLLAGLGLGSLFGKKGAKGGISKILGKALGSKAGLVGITAAASFAAGTAIDKFLLADIEDKVFDDFAKRQIKKKFGKAVTPEEQQAFREKVLAERKVAERKVAERKVARIQKEKIDESFAVPGVMRIAGENPEITAPLLGVNEPGGTQFESLESKNIPDIQDLETSAQPDFSEEFRNTIKNASTTPSASAPKADSGRSTDRKLSIEDPFMALINSSSILD